MTFRILISAFFAVSACLQTISAKASADGLPAGFVNDRLNPGPNPVTENGVTAFTIFDKVCSKTDYGDGRNENDCRNGNVRQALGGKKDARLGQTVSYKFDVWIDPSFRYVGFPNGMSKPYLPTGHDSRLRIASWEGEYLHNFIYILKLDVINGLSFMGKKCQGKDKFGTWTSFEMKVRWSRDEKGWVKASCDGVEIYSMDNVATNQAPHCYITNQCEPGIRKNPKSFHFTLGPVMAGFGPEWKKYGQISQFTPIQPEGITVKMRNLSITTQK